MTRADARRELVARLGDERVNDTLVTLLIENHEMLKALRKIEEVKRARTARRIATGVLGELDGIRKC